MIRQDYLTRLIGELREFVALCLGGGGRSSEEALLAVLNAQQKLFHREPAEFLQRDLDGQLDLLACAESPAGAVEKARVYAETLREAARVYAASGRTQLALSSRQLALGIVVTAALRWPEHSEATLIEVAAWRIGIDGEEQLPEPLRERLAAYDVANKR